MKMSPYEKVLHECLECANESPYRPGKDIREWTNTIVRARTKAAVTVTVTSLVKKCVDPAQDVRRHRVEIPGGYSGHDLDSKIVTPFLKANGFPAVSESGWVRRPFNQNAPYGLSYAGSIGDNGLKEAFLRVLDAVEGGKADPRSLLTYMLKQLVKAEGAGKGQAGQTRGADHIRDCTAPGRPFFRSRERQSPPSHTGRVCGLPADD